MKYYVLLLIHQKFSILKAGKKLKWHTVLCVTIPYPGHQILLEQTNPPVPHLRECYQIFKQMNIFWDIFRLFVHQNFILVLASSKAQWKEESTW